VGQAQGDRRDNDRRKDKIGPPGTGTDNGAKYFMHYEDPEKTVAGLGDPIGFFVSLRVAIDQKSSDIRAHSKGDIGKKPWTRSARTVPEH
jgi:hypothetical protein